MSSQNNGVLGLMNMVKNSANPQQAIMMLAQQNPQIANVINAVNQSGMSARDLFYRQAKQRGIDPNSILNNLR